MAAGRTSPAQLNGVSAPVDLDGESPQEQPGRIGLGAVFPAIRAGRVIVQPVATKRQRLPGQKIDAASSTEPADELLAKLRGRVAHATNLYEP